MSFPNMTGHYYQDESLTAMAELEYAGLVKSEMRWSERSRYETHSVQEARALLTALADGKHGVMEWLEQHWQRQSLQSARNYWLLWTLRACR